VGGFAGVVNQASIGGQSSYDQVVAGPGSVAGGMFGYVTNSQIYYANAYGQVSQSSETPTGTAQGSFGGFAGIIGTGGLVSQSTSSGSVTVGANTTAGGFVGAVQSSGEVSVGWAFGDVTQTAAPTSGNANLIGGFVGDVGPGADINQSYSTGNVSTVAGPSTLPTLAGGFAGLIEQSGQVTDSYAISGVAISGSGSGSAGGFVGELQGTIYDVYGTGLIQAGTTVAGGLIGTLENGSASVAYWDEGTTGLTNEVGDGSGTLSQIVGIGGTTGLSAFSASTYANFDLNNTWYIIDGYTRPFLRTEYSNNPSNTHQLQLMEMDPTSGYYLQQNLDYSIESNPANMWNPATGFAPIGMTAAAPFTGLLYGNGLTVSNLTIISNVASPQVDNSGFSTDGASGLFGFVGPGATIEYFNLSNTTVTATNGMTVGSLIGNLQGGTVYQVQSNGGAITGGDGVDPATNGFAYAAVGGLIGVEDGGSVSHATASTTVVGGDAYAGGLVGWLRNGGEISDADATGDVTVASTVLRTGQPAEAGGLIGDSTGTAPDALNTVSNAYATGSVTGGGGSTIGGFVGAATATNFSADWATGPETQAEPGQSTNVNGAVINIPNVAGGFAGSIGGGSQVSDSFASGAVSSVGATGAPAEAGGFVGNFQDSTINQAYAAGAVTTTGPGFTGGFAGLVQNDALIDQVYAAGAVSATAGQVGGLIGQIGNTNLPNDTTLVNDSYWDEGATGQTTGYTLAGGGAATGVVGTGGSTGVDPFAQATYVGWDFTATWSPPSDGYYPELYGVSHVIGIFAGTETTVYGTTPDVPYNMIGEQDFDNSFYFTGPTLNPVNPQLSTGGLLDVGNYGVLGSGASASDSYGSYRIVYLPGSLTVTPYALTAALTGTVEKTYDGTVAATLPGSSVQLTGAFAGDLVSVAGGTGTYDTKDVGSDKVVTVTGLSLTGSDAANYTVNQTAAADVGVIDPATLTAALIGETSKIYDSTTTAALTSSNYSLTGVIGSDSVSLVEPTSGVYDTKDVGTGKTVTASGLTLTGADAEDYTVAASASGAIGTITPASVTVALTGPVVKTYDGTTTAALSGGDFQVQGAYAGDSVSVSAAGVYDTKDVGSAKTVTASGITLTGADAEDYTATDVTTSAAVGIINPASLTVALIGSISKTYDGTTSATLTSANYSVSGILGGDSVSVTEPTSGVYADQNAGTGKTVTATGITLTGADAEDYTIANTASGAIGTINPIILTVGLIGTVQKTYDGNTAATLAADNYTTTGTILDGDTVNFVEPTSGVYDTAAVGTGKTVTVTGIGLTGAQAEDYSVNATASGPIGVIVAAAPTSIIDAPAETLFISSTGDAPLQPLTVTLQAQITADTAAAIANFVFNIDIFPLTDDDQDRADPRDASPITGAGNGDLWPGSDLDPETKP
jgi:hypothetical protein